MRPMQPGEPIFFEYNAQNLLFAAAAITGPTHEQSGRLPTNRI